MRKQIKLWIMFAAHGESDPDTRQFREQPGTVVIEQ